MSAARTVVGFVGLGAMGGRMAARLLDAGYELRVWNRTRERAVRLDGAQIAETPARAGSGADIVITMITDPEALVAVTEGPDGVAAGVREPTVVVEMSTVGPAAIDRLAAALPSGVDLLDAPVLGSLPEAEAGKLHVFVGGPPDVARRVMPLLEAFGTPHHVGPSGSGAAAKLVANSTLFGALGVLGEALALADGLGLSRDAAFEVLSVSPMAAQAQRRRAAVESGDYEPRFALPLALKDADLVLRAAATQGVDVRLARAARSWLADAVDAGLADRDYSAALALMLGSAGRSVRSEDHA